MPPPLRLTLGALLVLLGLVLMAVAVLGARSRLRRNRWVGVRTPATLGSDAAFTVANEVAAAPTGAAGAVALVGGVALLGAPSAALAWVVLPVSIVGALVLAGVGRIAGDRAAAALPPPTPAPSTCSGTCAGCDLVAGCRPAAERTPDPAPAEQPGAGTRP